MNFHETNTTLKDFLIADTPVTARGSRKFVLRKFMGGQGFRGEADFRHGPGIRGFALNRESVRFRGDSHRRERVVARRIRQVSCNFVD